MLLSVRNAQISAAILPYFSDMGLLSGRLSELSRRPDEIRAENLRAWTASVEGANPISEVEARCGCKVAGVVQNIIIDGSGSLVAKWLGRSSLQGIRLGVGLIIQGLAGVSREDEFIVLNPEYSLVPGPEHG